MPITINNTTITSVHIIDDDPKVRETYKWTISDSDLEPIEVEGPLHDLQSFIDELTPQTDAVICDHKLSVKDYARFNGAESIAILYHRHKPGILCTNWITAAPEEIRKHRRFIPVLIDPLELNPQTIIDGFSLCIKEFEGSFQVHRKPWKTSVRIEELDYERGYIFVVAPGWKPSEVIRLSIDSVPQEIRSEIDSEGKMHFSAEVNLGAEEQRDIYFHNWNA